MKNIIYKTAATLCFLGLFTANNLIAQSIPADFPLGTKGHIIHSRFNQKDYQLEISLPANYSANEKGGYPVLFVLDGKYAFAMFHAIRQVMDMGKELDKIIIVGINDGSKGFEDWIINRQADYTPTNIPRQDSMFTKIFNMKAGLLQSGRAALFLQTLKQDIIPFIDSTYSTSKSRGLSGHSLGGLFTAYCLLTDPGLFDHYGINSPSLWWDENEIRQLAGLFENKQLTKATKVFISVGEFEGPMMVTPMSTFAAKLTACNKDNLSITTQQFPGETHVSVVAACTSRTLKVLYKK